MLGGEVKCNHSMMSTSGRLAVVMGGLVMACALLFLAVVPQSEGTGGEWRPPTLPGVKDIVLSTEQFHRFRDSVNRFALNLFHKVASSEVGGNVFYSPSSITLSLGLVYLGSHGATQREISSALQMDSFSFEQVAKGFRMLMEETFEKDSLTKVHMINQLWVDRSFPVHESFLKHASEFFDSQVNQLDIRNHPEEARIAINEHISTQTEKKIANLIPASSLDSLTRMVIANAIYFKGAWASPFEEENTSDSTFLTSQAKEVSVRMMSISKRISYLASSGYQVIEIPYKGNDFSLVAYLPDSPKAELSHFPEIDLSQLLSTHVDLSFPKFSMNQAIQLRDTLSQLGLDGLFSSCNLSRISSLPLEISEVYHQAFIKIDEAGTEASAATSVVIKERGLVLDSKVLIFNRPFFFSIRNIQSGVVIFQGLLNHPLP
jgi:serpin B